jgi:Transposase.
MLSTKIVFTLPVAAKYLGIPFQDAKKLLESGKFQRTIKVNNCSYAIFKDDLDKYLRENKHLSPVFELSTAAQYLGIYYQTFLRLIQYDKELNSILIKSTPYTIRKDDLDNYIKKKKNLPETLTLKQAAQYFGICLSAFYNLMQSDKKLSNIILKTKKAHKQYAIPKEKLDNYIKEKKLFETFNITEAARYIGVPYATMYMLIKSDKITTSNYTKKKPYVIQKEELDKYIEKMKSFKTFNRTKAAQYIGVSGTTLSRLVQSGEIKNSTLIKNKQYAISKVELDNYINEKKIFDTVNLTKAAEYLGISTFKLHKLIQSGKIKDGTIMKGKSYMIIKKALDNYIARLHG